MKIKLSDFIKHKKTPMLDLNIESVLYDDPTPISPRKVDPCELRDAGLLPYFKTKTKTKNVTITAIDSYGKELIVYFYPPKVDTFTRQFVNYMKVRATKKSLHVGKELTIV